jgi:hypothetical protein
MEIDIIFDKEEKLYFTDTQVLCLNTYWKIK